MAITVNTNVASLNAQRTLGKSVSTLNKSLARLSSGLRINSGADDAAGLSISNGLTSQINGMNQAIRNVGDGLSMLGTADGALEQQTNILQRMRELAVQASSDTNSNANRTSINNEAGQLKSELERIARTTQFNGNSLLDGTFQGRDIQVGSMSTANDRISVSMSSSKAADIGIAYKAGGTLAVSNAAMAAGNLTLTVGGSTYTVGGSVSDGVSLTAAQGGTGGADTASALAKANAINALTNSTGVTASASTSVSFAQAAGSLTSGDLKINNVNIGAVTTTSVNDQSLVSAINAQYAQTGVMASLDSGNNVVLTAADGRNIDVTAPGAGTATNVLTGVATGTTFGKVTLSSTDAFTVGGTGVAVAGQAAAAAQKDTANNVNTIDLTSKSGAQNAIKTLDVALSQLNSRRADIGALTNRLDTTTSNLSSAVENASSSRSRIQDVDFASETANMSRSQILQQAGVAVLAQANQTPQLALSLLK